MKRFCVVFALLCSCGCTAPQAESDYRDAVAVDLALATMTDSPAPLPKPDRCERCRGTGYLTHGDGHRTPCPDCQGGAEASFGGPLDTLRDAKELIRKGSDLADRGKTILDQAQRDGKITVDIRLPEPPAAVTATTQSPPVDLLWAGSVATCHRPPMTRPPIPCPALRRFPLSSSARAASASRVLSGGSADDHNATENRCGNADCQRAASVPLAAGTAAR